MYYMFKDSENHEIAIYEYKAIDSLSYGEYSIKLIRKVYDPNGIFTSEFETKSKEEWIVHYTELKSDKEELIAAIFEE